MTQEILTKLVVDCETGTETIVPLTTEELAERHEMSASIAEQQAKFEAEVAAVAEAKASAEAKLAALGLTTEEIAALSK